ncbi:hypothetical protein [Tardiphaga sp.]|uniref:hypothetical protein n=1 Tax=Tardiphaga sp. TaxID=1926292 RepID=UPI00260459E1|nr:hypothetical protein [Tardiphaga sp.]MDB5621017.1 hypothetical protein [Tardiphaga sp.]
MITSRDTRSETALLSLEAAASSARAGFACMFSTSDEYENALISERRAQGRYGATRRRWPAAAFVGCALAVVATVLLFA